jgi:hypothetical protein
MDLLLAVKDALDDLAFQTTQTTTSCSFDIKFLGCECFHDELVSRHRGECELVDEYSDAVLAFLSCPMSVDLKIKMVNTLNSNLELHILLPKH